MASNKSGSQSKHPANRKPQGKRTQGNSRKANGSVETVRGDIQYNDPNDRLAPEPVGSQVYNYSFSNFLGTDVPIYHPLNMNMFTTDPVERVPSIMTLYLNPSPGNTGAPGSLHQAAINQQGLRTFTALSSGNAKTTQYSPQDVTTALLAIGELISTFEYARRCLGLAKLYNIRNRAYPRLALEASGINAVDMFEKLAQYRIRFNLLALQANKIPFPANVKYFNACYNLYRDVFTDEENNPMAQTYMFVPYSTWMLDETSSPQGSTLSTVVLQDSLETGGSMTFAALLNKLESMITCLMTSSTLNYVYSDVIRLADKNNIPLFSIAACAEDYAVVPIYSHEAMLQIENAVLVGKPVEDTAAGYTSNNDVLPVMDENALFYRPRFVAGTPYLGSARFVNFDSDNPSLEDRVAATRFMATAFVSTFDNATEKFTSTVSTPDHYVVGLSIWANDSSALVGILNSGRYSTEEQSYFTKFKHHPMLINYLKSGSGANTKFTYKGVFGDLAYWTTLDKLTLDNIHKCSFFELFELK